MKVSKQTASKIEDRGPAEDRSEDVDGYTINFVSIREDADLTGALEGLPGDSCPCHHWGYLIKGTMTVRYGDHEETIEAGDAFYMSPGHVPAAKAGTEFVQFSPADELAAIQAAMQQNMQAKANR